MENKVMIKEQLVGVMNWYNKCKHKKCLHFFVIILIKKMIKWNNIIMLIAKKNNNYKYLFIYLFIYYNDYSIIFAIKKEILYGNN